MFFLFDENVPYKFVRGLSLIEEANYKTEISAQISHPKDINNQGASDEAQIEYAGMHNGVIVSFDKDFKHMKSYYPLYKQFKVGVIVLNLTKKESNYWGIVKTIINRWEELKIAANETERPFVLEITSKGVEKRNF
jgi:predicted nuclease of predicted toxin-antitoxin system